LSHEKKGISNYCLDLNYHILHTWAGHKKQKAEQDVIALIDKYSLARENKDTVLLKRILTTDVDQLVSTGEWRNGIKGSMSGMLRSSAGSPGMWKLIVETFLQSGNRNCRCTL